MKNNKLCPYIITLGVSLLTIFFFWHIPFIDTLSGYVMLALWRTNAWGAMATLFQTFIMIDLVVLTVIGTLGIFKESGRFQTNLNLFSISFISLCIFACLSFIEFVFIIALSSSININFGIGSIIQTIASVVALCMFKLGNKQEKTADAKQKTKKSEI